MLRGFLILLVVLIPTSAMAGVRATYTAPGTAPMVIEIADNGDINARLGDGLRFVVLANRSYFVEDRLTGPVVMRLEDLSTLLRPASRPQAAPVSRPQIVQRGTAVVNGRTGRAYFYANATGPEAETPTAVISSDPTLSIVGGVLNRVFAAKSVFGALYWGWPAEAATDEDELGTLLERWAPLRYGDLVLRTFEQRPIDSASFALPAEPESAEALRRRHAAETARDEDPHAADRMISRAVFADGRLWLLTDHGQLSSLAEGEARRTAHDLGENVLDICVEGGSAIALTGERASGRRWTIRRRQAGTWRPTGSVARSGDALIALSCGSHVEMVLTNRRLIDLTGARPALTLSEPLQRRPIVAVVHMTPDAAWLGMNAGEWGGGMLRIDRRSGAVATIARNATGGLCDGPLNTSCDPVNGIATIPSRPRCVAAAIGLIHMAAHGRIAAVCPEGVEQLYAAADALDPDDPRAVAEAASGGYGSIAFFGLTATADALIAVGHNGLYRLEANGTGTRRPWPRFVEVDGVLVSFALPDVVLVMTAVNGRASLSGITPLMAVR